MQVDQRQHLTDLGDLRHHSGRIYGKNRIRSPVAASTLLSFTRGAVTSTEPAASPGAVRFGSQLGYVLADFDPQRHGKHPPGTLTDRHRRRHRIKAASAFRTWPLPYGLPGRRVTGNRPEALCLSSRSCR